MTVLLARQSWANFVVYDKSACQLFSWASVFLALVIDRTGFCAKLAYSGQARSAKFLTSGRCCFRLPWCKVEAFGKDLHMTARLAHAVTCNPNTEPDCGTYIVISQQGCCPDKL